ncbi:uncharacterized protein LOC107053851 isoform X2 [Gallus gallus]|uniref:uncharacterized protein LOC107053851 isoform X2 n=1 Tax=Gallus gallus TaxID=9031 RepID=UPI001AE33549|nr:uncharacterized protein LOC107053851 isoform X2 [Gallus gallus]
MVCAVFVRVSAWLGAPLFSGWVLGLPLGPKERVALRRREGGPRSQSVSQSPCPSAALLHREGLQRVLQEMLVMRSWQPAGQESRYTEEWEQLKITENKNRKVCFRWGCKKLPESCSQPPLQSRGYSDDFTLLWLSMTACTCTAANEIAARALRPGQLLSSHSALTSAQKGFEALEDTLGFGTYTEPQQSFLLGSPHTPSTCHLHWSSALFCSNCLPLGWNPKEDLVKPVTISRSREELPGLVTDHFQACSRGWWDFPGTTWATCGSSTDSVAAHSSRSDLCI